jgi:hypothetical protein
MIIVRNKNSNKILKIIVVPIIAIFLIIVGLLITLNRPGFSVPGLGPSSCIAISGYYCQNAIYSHMIAKIFVTIGENTGTNWTSANFIFVPQGNFFNNEMPWLSFNSYPVNDSYSKIGLNSGQQVTISLPIKGVSVSVPIGTSVQGSIWVQYAIAQNSMTQYAEMATISIKAS